MAFKRIPVEETFSWQRPVRSMISVLPGGPAKGDRYILTTDGSINWFNGAAWFVDKPAAGWAVFNLNDWTKYVFDGTAWHSFLENAYIEDSISDRSTEITDTLEQYQQEISDYILALIAKNGLSTP